MTVELILVGVSIALMAGLVILYGKYSGLKSEKEVLEEIVRVKDKTIENYKKARGHTIESEEDKVLAYAAEGMEPDEIARRLDMPTSKVDMIVRFDALRRKKEEETSKGVFSS